MLKRWRPTSASGLGNACAPYGASAAGRRFYLAVHTGLGRIYISDIERGAKEPCLRTLETLADGFEIPLSELFRNL